MHSYLLEFNLRQRGDEAQEYLADAVRTWPKLWEDIPGVTGTLLLSSALALGGEFEYLWRVDIAKLSTLSRIDDVMKSGENGWRKTRAEWFKARTVARAHIADHVGGLETYCQRQEGKSGAIHFVFHSRPEESGRSADRLKAVRSVPGVVATQALRTVAGSTESAEQTWLRLDSLDSLDNVAEVDRVLGSGRLFGEIREVDGSLFAGA
ncbi:hypothetical protein GCM10011608_18330 [Micromonospora sonchi]|uniref:Uncharacterized protein n=1 Tax=Micromonospora sonchi TaxID=1763543 RepID=A0A917WW76_9ACTN|nr:hypothetical protein [Micromonospora sonchi]GGM34188.1 hypothetical protein GCM10011608_18330 [Micromonospora sonchi]